MGWLFGKKKVPQVPMPGAKPADDKALKFPEQPGAERVIQADAVKEAVGPGPQSEPQDNPLPDPAQMEPAVDAAPVQQVFGGEDSSEPLFVKVDVYQRVLGELDNIKSNLSRLSDTNRKIETAEYNEEDNFEKLRRAVKNVHDKLLQMDKTMFKT